MKRLVISLSIIVFIILACVTSLFYLRSTKEVLLSSLSEISVEKNLGNTEGAITLSDKLFDYYSRQNDYLVLFIEHDRLEELEETLSRLSPLLSSEDNGEFSAELSKAVALTEKLYEHEKPMLKNIL